MRLKKNLELRDVCGENVVIPCGIENVDFDCIVHLNETGAFLWKEAEKGEFCVESLVQAMLEEYDVAEDVAKSDVQAFVEKLKAEKLAE